MPVTYQAATQHYVETYTASTPAELAELRELLTEYDEARAARVDVVREIIRNGGFQERN